MVKLNSRRDDVPVMEETLMKPAQTPKPPSAQLRRREFLLTASLGSIGAVAAAVATHSPPAAEAAPAAAPDDAGRGYQLTDHVLRYYRSTRI